LEDEAPLITDIAKIFSVTRLNLRTCFLWIWCIKNH